MPGAWVLLICSHGMTVRSWQAETCKCPRFDDFVSRRHWEQFRSHLPQVHYSKGRPAGDAPGFRLSLSPR